MAGPTETIQVKRFIPQSEVNELAKRQNNAMTEIENLDGEKKIFNDQIKSKQGKLRAEVRALSHKITSGVEYVDKLVYVRHNWTTGMKEFICVTTGNVLDSEPIPPKAMKRQLEIDEHEKREVVGEQAKSVQEYFTEKFTTEIAPDLEDMEDRFIIEHTSTVFQNRRIAFITSVVNLLYDTEKMKEGTDFDIAFDAIEPMFDSFVECTLVDLQESINQRAKQQKDQVKPPIEDSDKNQPGNGESEPDETKKPKKR